MAIEKIGVSIWLTTNCNMNCTYCYEKDMKDKNDISLELIDQIISFLIKIGKTRKVDEFSIAFHGGEPLIKYSWIVEFIERIKKEEFFQNKVVQYEMTTNTLLLNEDKIKFLSENIQKISVSLDGAKQSHDSMRIRKDGSGTHDEVIRNSLKLLQVKPDINARMTVNTKNIYDFQENLDYVVGYGFQNIIPVIDIWDKAWEESNALLIEQCNTYIRTYHERNEEFKGNIEQLIPDNFNRLICDGGTHSFNISPMGDIYPCSFWVGDPKYWCGNVVQGLDKNALQKIECVKNTEMSECKGCNNYDLCISSRCKFVNERYWGNAGKAIPIVCYMEHLKIKHVNN